jgi:opacity protein-like surface antigen
MLAAVLAVALPTGALAAEVDLQVKIDKLTQQMEDLKGQVQRMEDKSLGKWLKIGGSYQFRVDSLRGETVGYVSPNAMFNYMGNNALLTTQNTIFDTLGNPMFPAGTSVGQILQLANAQMGQVTSYQAASMQASTFMAMLGQLYNDVATNPMAAGDPAVIAVPAYKPKNETLYTNKFNLDLKAQATKDVTVNVKLGMYKVFGSQNDDAVTSNAFFADRTGVFDGTLGHTPSDSKLNVDRAYATWSNILEQPLWFSVGRRPATDGAPLNLKLNTDRPGNGGTPALLVNYAFDGMTVGYAPDIDALPGFYAKVCYGRGFDSGFKTSTNSLKDTDMLGVAVIPVDTDPLRVWLQWNRGFNIFDFPVMENTAFGDTAPSTNLGSIDWYGIGAMSTLKKVGPGDLNFFVDGGLSRTNPNNNVSAQAGFQGLLTGGFMNPEAPDNKTGYAVYAGVRYDLPSKTKLGFEYNYGSKNWITFSPAADDMWTSKVGTRGQVFEPYIIQELDLKPVSSYFAKAFFRLGYQYYDFKYTGSNNWVGAPLKISELTGNEFLLQAPVKKAQNIYGTFEVQF